ncbi:unnamed protein product [Paramecium pentaurelia]|uniref:Uncharacterized protein n=1 Tax=Paramecium pentaurelia TaxID=43138 RepID=A0A8S1Y7X7_9CILI|nr:unnamed protein product [Paramecium pentaurelia]
MLRLSFKQQKRQSFQQKMKICELLLERGLKFFELEQFGNAIDQFEICMSVFADAKTPKKWEETTYEELTQQKYPEQQQIERLHLKLFEKMAECYYRLHEQGACTKMCDYWLQMSPQCINAIILRAKSRFLSDNITQIDCQMAFKDLKFAQQLDPHNTAIAKFYEKVKAQLLAYKELEYQNYTDLQRKQLELINQYRKQEDDDDEDAQQDFMAHLAYQDYDQELSYELDNKKPIPIEVSELGRFIETRGMEMVKIYQQNGQLKEAEDLREKLKKAIAAKKQLEKISQLDFNRPKKKLNEFAQKYGINLLDPQVQNEFKRIQEQNLEDIRQWLKQNQWNYTDKATQMQEQELARQELAKLQFKRKTIPQKHNKNKFNKKVQPLINNTQVNGSMPVTINNNITYNQTFNQCNNVINNSTNEQSDEQLTDCNCFINLIILLLAIFAILATIYYSFIK